VEGMLDEASDFYEAMSKETADKLVEVTLTPGVRKAIRFCKDLRTFKD
jgi:hypothetical protein